MNTLIDLSLGHVRLFSHGQQLLVPSAEYGPPEGLPELREALAAKHRVPASCVTITTGSSMGLTALLSSRRPTALLLPRPYYPSYPRIAEFLGLHAVFYAAVDAEGRPNVSAAVESMTSHPGSTLLWNFPHNPTGAVDSESDRQVLRGAAAASGAEIVFDCAYADLVFDVPAETPARISSGEASVFSLSKSLGLAGERVGYVLGTEERSLEVRRAHWALAMSPPVTSQRIATAALEDESATVASLRNELENLRRIAGSHVSACHAVRYRTPAGGIFAWLEIPTLIGGDRVIAAACERTGVLVAPGQLFGVSEYTALRVSFAVPEPELRQGLEVVLKVIDRAVARSAESA